MSVDYNSALIYGYSCDPKDWPYEARDAMEELGWDVISDYYSDKFLYIGKIISHTSCFEEARVDCLASIDQVEIDIKHIYADTPMSLVQHLPLYRSIYHLCYAT